MLTNPGKRLVTTTLDPSQALKNIRKVPASVSQNTRGLLRKNWNAEANISRVKMPVSAP
jgi:hypothetical protein